MSRTYVNRGVGSIIGRLSLTGPAITDAEETKGATLVSLPNELLQHIASFLPITSAASLAFSGRHLRQALGDQYWLPLKDVTRSPLKLDFLIMLERDLPGYVLCHCCNRLHSWIAEETPRRASQWGEVATRRECIMRDQIKLDHVPAYDLRFRHCQLVMNAYRYGPAHGIFWTLCHTSGDTAEADYPQHKSSSPPGLHSMSLFFEFDSRYRWYSTTVPKSSDGTRLRFAPI